MMFLILEFMLQKLLLPFILSFSTNDFRKTNMQKFVRNFVLYPGRACVAVREVSVPWVSLAPWPLSLPALPVCAGPGCFLLKIWVNLEYLCNGIGEFCKWGSEWVRGERQGADSSPDRDQSSKVCSRVSHLAWTCGEARSWQEDVIFVKFLLCNNYRLGSVDWGGDLGIRTVGKIILLTIMYLYSIAMSLHQ